MDILREAKLMGVEPDAKDALGKTAKQSGTDDVRIAFTTLMDSISATPQPEIDDSILKSSMMHSAVLICTTGDKKGKTSF